MKRTAKDQNDVRRPKPVEKIELSEKHLRLRFVIVILLIAVAIAATVHIVTSLLSKSGGWQTVTASTSENMNCASDFFFRYEFGRHGQAVNAEFKAVTAAYTEATEAGYRIFHATELFDGVHNLAYLNAHPNAEVELDETLYGALEQLEKAGSRYAYFAPVYDVYGWLFACGNDLESYRYDPYRNETVKNDLAEMAGYANDPEMIRLELLGDNRARLIVSDDYRAYAEKNQIKTYMDLFWLKNAFLTDYLADRLIADGITAGYLSCYDGFCRNLDEEGTAFSCDLYDLDGNTILQIADLQFDKPCALVMMRTFPVGGQNGSFTYVLQNGECRTAFIDFADGLCKSGVSNLLAYSKTKSCAEIAIRMYPLFASATFDGDAVTKAEPDGIFTVYAANRTVYYHDPSLPIGNLFEGYQLVLTH